MVPLDANVSNNNFAHFNPDSKGNMRKSEYREFRLDDVVIEEVHRYRGFYSNSCGLRC